MSEPNSPSEAEPSRESPFYALSTRQKTWIVGGVIGWIIGSFAAGTQIMDWFGRASGPKFSVELSTERFVSPISDLYSKIGIEDGGKLNEIHGVLIATIKNVGELDAENVMFDARDTGYATTKFDDDSGDAVEFNRRINIGTIHSGQTVNLLVWGKDNSFFQDGSPLLIHKHGQQVIPHPNDFWAHHDKTILYFLCAVVGGLVSTFLAVLQRLISRLRAGSTVAASQPVN